MPQESQRDMLHKYESSSNTYNKFRARLRRMSQNVADRINVKRTENYCNVEIDMKKHELISMITNQISKKVKDIFQRQAQNVIGAQKAHQNLKVYDYIVFRQNIFPQTKQNSLHCCDEEEDQLDEITRQLSAYYDSI